MMNRITLVAAVVTLAFGAASPGQNFAASFDGNGTGWAEAPHNATLVPTAGITVEAWVWRSPTNSSGHRAIVRKNSATFNESYNLRVTDGQARWIIKTQTNGTVELNTGSTVATGSWHHLAGTFDNTASRIYLDGALIGQILGLTGPLLNTGNPLKIANGDGEPWSGYLDNIRIWSVARTQQEIQLTMNYQVSGVPNLISSWHLNNNFLDSTGTNHATVMGTVPFVPGAPLIGFLVAPTVSPVGSPLVFQINNPTGGLPYVLDVSISGTSPGVTLAPGIVLPLNPPWLNYETGASLSSIFVNFFGILNATGHATPYVNVPAIPALSGTVVSATYVSLDPASPTLIDFIAPPTQTTLAGPAPVISSVMPAIGPTTGGTQITISGNNFQSGATVQVGTNQGLNVIWGGPNTLSFTLPGGTLGPKAVTVTNPDLGSTTLNNAFTYVAPLLLTQVAPLVAAPGATIVVTGSGIQIGATLQVGGSPVTPIAVSSTQVSFSNPAGVPCGGPIQVTNPDTQLASIAFNPTPSLTAMLPSSGPAAGGTVVSIVGTNFFPGSTVRVNGNVIPSNLLGATLITATMPPGSPGPASVTVTSANNCMSAAGTFTYQ